MSRNTFLQVCCMSILFNKPFASKFACKNNVCCGLHFCTCNYTKPLLVVTFLFLYLFQKQKHQPLLVVRVLSYCNPSCHLCSTGNFILFKYSIREYFIFCQMHHHKKLDSVFFSYSSRINANLYTDNKLNFNSDKSLIMRFQEK